MAVLYAFAVGSFLATVTLFIADRTIFRKKPRSVVKSFQIPADANPHTWIRDWMRHHRGAA